nr:hypothetical protein [Tanacetum cinerariifolium]
MGTVEDKILIPKPLKTVHGVQDFQNSSEPSNASTNVVNAPREPYVVKQDNGSFVDKIIFRDPDSPDQFHCFHCKDVLRYGEACKRCTCVKCGSGLGKGLCYICGHNQNSLNDSPSISETSSQSPPNINHCCYECGDPLDGILCKRCTFESPFTLDSTPTYVDESPNVFNPPPQPSVYPCEFCGNDAYYGHYYTPQAPFIYPEPCYNQDFNFSQDFQTVPPKYPCCDDCGVTHDAYQCQPMNEVYYYGQNSCYDSTSIGFDQSQPQQYTVDHPIFNREEKRIEEEQAAKAQTWKFPICYDDDDDEEGYNSLNDNIISEPPPYSAVTPTEPVDSLSMGDEHLDTISAMKSDEFIKSCVENLVPNPSESDGENECDVPAGFTTFSNVLFDADYDFDYGDDQSFSDEDFPKKIYSNPLFDEEIIPMEIDKHSFNAERKFILPRDCCTTTHLLVHRKKLFLTILMLILNIESISPSPILVEDSDSHMEEIDLPFTLDDPMPSGIEDDDYESERDILILDELLDNYSLSLPTNESYHFDIPSPYRPPAKPPDGNTGTLNIKMMGDVADQKVPVPNLTITRVLNQEKSPDLLSHLGSEAFQPSAECPMIINGKNIPLLDASPPDSELVSSEAMEIVIPEVGGIDDDILLTIKHDVLREKLKNVNLLISKIKALNANPTTSSDCKTNSGSPTTHSDSSLYASFMFDLSINPFPPADRSDSYEFTDELIPFISASEYDCFLFKVEPNLRDFTKDVVENISPTKEPQVLNTFPTHPTLQLNMKFQPSSESLFAYVVWIFLPFLVYSAVPPYLLSLRNEDIIFDPGICKSIFSRPDISHRCETVKKFNTHRSHLNKFSMLIHGQNNPLLDVLLFHFYPP